MLQAVPDRTNEFPDIKFHYALSNRAAEDGEDEEFVRKMRPQYLFQMPDEDQDAFYVSGTYRGTGAITKYYKRNAAMRWHAQLDRMTRVDAIAVRNPGTIFGCGQNNYEDRLVAASERERDSEAWIFKMDADGEA